jgi:hypothetical protein
MGPSQDAKGGPGCPGTALLRGPVRLSLGGGLRVRLHKGALPRDYQSMRRSANLSAEKLVGDYLRRVLDAAQRVLPKGDRLLFVGRTRAVILKRAGPLATADPAKVMQMLAELGDPRTIVKKELERLETAHRGGPPRPVVLWKPVKDEWKPSRDDTEPIPRQPAEPSPAGSSPADSPSAGPSPAGPSPAGSPPAGPSPAGSSPAGPWPAVPSSPAGPSRPASEREGTDQPGEHRPSVAPAPAAPTVRALARSHPLETVAILLLGVGGLILPFLWIIGGLVAVASRVWDARDKWLALLGTPLFLFAGLLAAGVLVGGRHGFFGEFIHAFDAYREYLLRAGAVLSAIYLGWRIRRGPRMRSLPPWQRPQRGPTR